MSSDPRDYKLDISGLAPEASPPLPAPSRPFVSVLFDCCSVYQRIYRSADGKTYDGHCPKCRLPVKFIIGDGGTAARVFRAK